VQDERRVAYREPCAVESTTSARFHLKSICPGGYATRSRHHGYHDSVAARLGELHRPFARKQSRAAESRNPTLGAPSEECAPSQRAGEFFTARSNGPTSKPSSPIDLLTSSSYIKGLRLLDFWSHFGRFSEHSGASLKTEAVHCAAGFGMQLRQPQSSAASGSILEARRPKAGSSLSRRSLTTPQGQAAAAGHTR